MISCNILSLKSLARYFMLCNFCENILPHKFAISILNGKTSASVCKTLCPQSLLAPEDGQICKEPKFHKFLWNSLKVNHLIHSSSPISWPSFKLLAQILFEISCWQDFILNFSKGHNSRKGDNSDKTKLLVSYFSIRNPHMKFQNLACAVHKICHASKSMTNWRTNWKQYAPSISLKFGS